MSKTILYIDDEPWFVEPLVDALTEDGYTVELVINGWEAIEKLKQTNKLPDLIVLDVIMPMGGSIHDTTGGRRTGLRVHEIIRKQLLLRMPVIFVTVVDDPGVERDIANVEKGQRANNFAILVKPVLPTELLEKVSAMLCSSQS